METNNDLIFIEDMIKFYTSISDDKWITGGYIERHLNPSSNKYDALGHLGESTYVTPKSERLTELFKRELGVSVIDVNDAKETIKLSYPELYTIKQPRLRILMALTMIQDKLSGNKRELF